MMIKKIKIKNKLECNKNLLIGGWNQKGKTFNKKTKKQKNED